MMAENLLPAEAAQDSFQRRNLFQAGRADRERRNIHKRRLADTAVRRNQDGEQAFSRVLKNLFQPA
jgi:hypothetical protein